MAVLGMFQACGTESHALNAYCFHSYGPEFCTYWLDTSDKNRKPGEGFSSTRQEAIARKLQNLTMLVHALSPLLYKILRYNPITTQNSLITKL